MNIQLRFDFHSCTVFVPDGIVTDAYRLQQDFLEWAFEQPNCITSDHNGDLALRYDENDFITFVNDVLLKDCNERAYKYSDSRSEKMKIQKVIRF